MPMATNGWYASPYFMVTRLSSSLFCSESMIFTTSPIATPRGW